MAATTETKHDGSPDLSSVMESAFSEGMADLTASGTLEPVGEPEPTTAEPVPAAAEPVTAEPTKVEPAKADAKAEPVLPVPDPYEGTQPLTLTVDGKPLQIPELLLADGGGLVPPDKLQALTDRIERGVQAEQMVQRLTEEGRQHTHVLGQLSHTVGEDTYTGLAAFEAMKAEGAAMLAGTKSLLGFLNDPTFVYNLAYARQQGDEATAKALMQQAIDGTSASYKLATATGLRAADKLQLTGPAPAPVPPEAALGGAVDFLVNHPSMQGLTAEDRAAALRHFGPAAEAYVKTATTPEEAQKAGVKVGEPYAFYAKMLPWFEDRLAYRKREAERAVTQTKEVQDAEKAGAFNARVNRNRQPAPKVLPKTVEQPRAKDGTFKKGKQESTYDIFTDGMAELNLPV